MKGYERNMKPIEKALWEYLYEYSEENGSRSFLFDESRTFTAADAFAATEVIANVCTDFGVKEGSCVLLRCTRCIDSFLIYLALEMMGATAVLTDPHLGARDYVKATGIDIKADFVISNENASNDISASGNWKLSNGVIGTPLTISYPVVREPKRYKTVTNLYAPATIIFTSGSTGQAKAVMLSQYNIVNHFRNHSVVVDFNENDCSIDLLPVHHVFGLGLLLMGLLKRYTVFFPKLLSLEYTAECIEKYRITWLDSVPSFFLALADYHKRIGFKADTLRGGNVGGAPSTKAQFDFIESELGMKLLPVYGQSECIAISAGGDWESDVVRSSTVGKFLPMNEGYILDENGDELPLGREGEVCVKGPAVLLGYYGDEHATQEAIDEQGRLHTGDLGWVDQDGYLHISGRKKDIIIRNGNNISVGKVEAALLELPAVVQACVVGVHHEKYGEIPCALVVSNGKADEGALQAALKEKLSKHEIPEKIRFAQALPLTSTGKPDKQKIKTMF